MYKIDNIGIIVNFVPYICNFLLYLQNMTLVNIKIITVYQWMQ